MAQTFSQLIRIYKNTAVQYEIKVHPEEPSDPNQALQWFKHHHWQETLQLLRPVVQSHVIKSTQASKDHNKLSGHPSGHPSATIKGNGLFVAYKFKSCSATQSFSPSSKSEQKCPLAPGSAFRDLGAMHSRYDVFHEKLYALVCPCHNDQAISHSKQRMLLKELESGRSPCYEPKVTMRPSSSKSSSSSALDNYGVSTSTESIKCHQDSKSKSNRDSQMANQQKVKALSSCQLGNGHKCRSSAVKLSPSSANAQENVMLSKNEGSCHKKRTLNPSSQHEQSKKFKCNDSDKVRDKFKSKPVAARPRLPSLTTSTESIMCTVIDHNGRKSVTSPNNIRMVNKLPAASDGSVNGRRHSSPCHTSPCSNEFGSSGIHLAEAKRRSASETQQQDLNSSNSTTDEDEHQREVTKLFDQLFESAASSSRAAAAVTKRRHSFAELAEQHLSPKQTSSHVIPNDLGGGTKGHLEDADSSNFQQADLSQKYNTMTETFKNISCLKELPEEVLAHWFSFNEYYLQGINNRKIFSRRHEHYVKGGRLRHQLNYQVNVCLFSEHQLDFIMDHIIQMFKSDSSRGIDYYMKVLLPEVLIKIFMDVYGMGHGESELKMDKMISKK